MQQYWRSFAVRSLVALAVVLVVFGGVAASKLVFAQNVDSDGIGVQVVQNQVGEKTGNKIEDESRIESRTENKGEVAQNEQVIVSVFVRDDCQHCIAEKAFLVDLTEKRDDFVIKYHDLSDPYEYEKFAQIAETFGLVKGTPITLVGNSLFGGFDKADTTGVMMERIIDNALGGDLLTGFDDALANTDNVKVVSSLASSQTCSDEPGEKCETGGIVVRIPIIGKTLDLSTYSLSAMSMTLGLIDGFNPCALWVLVMFLTLLLQAGSRKRMWQYAGLFIVAEAVMYYLILTVWLSAWNFIGLSKIVTPLVGLLALGSGIYFLYKWRTWQPVCSVASNEQQNKITQKITDIAKKPMSWAVALGILALAFSVNIFEFACSIGIPQTFTKILEMNELNFWETQGQMGLYIMMYMLDDVVVFALALAGAGKLSRMMKYSKFATLIGGLLMLVLGVIMIFAPEILVF